MRALYSRNEKGKVHKAADIYTRDEHLIQRRNVDPDAIKIVRRLQHNGHDTYVVGGAVRDLILGKHPKDFDIATDATPNQIRKLFRNSRIIGKRFRLIHIFFGDKIIEVSTFRSQDSEGFKNVFGTIDEDVFRRDFSANALYYDPEKETVLDYVGGVRDLKEGRLKPIIPLPRIFSEDPVRMIRAIKYATLGDLKLSWALRRRIRRDHDLLTSVPSSRMTEEIFKILGSGRSREIVHELWSYNLFRYLLPQLDSHRGRSNDSAREALRKRLGELDLHRSTRNGASRSDAIATISVDYLLFYSEFAFQKRIPSRDAYFTVKELLRPVTPANREVDEAVSLIFRRKKALLDGAPLFKK